MSRPGDLSADIARVGGVGNVVGFNVSLYIWPLALFSTFITCKCFFFLCPPNDFMFCSCHHGPDLLVQLVSCRTYQGDWGRLFSNGIVDIRLVGSIESCFDIFHFFDVIIRRNGFVSDLFNIAFIRQTSQTFQSQLFSQTKKNIKIFLS